MWLESFDTHTAKRYHKLLTILFVSVRTETYRSSFLRFDSMPARFALSLGQKLTEKNLPALRMKNVPQLAPQRFRFSFSCFEDIVDHRSYVHNLSSSEIKLWKKFRPERDSNPWPLRYSTNWAIKPSGSWSHCEFLTIYP